MFVNFLLRETVLFVAHPAHLRVFSGVLFVCACLLHTDCTARIPPLFLAYIQQYVALYHTYFPALFDEHHIPAKSPPNPSRPHLNISYRR